MTGTPQQPDPFEEEIRRTLAREAAEPAPERLIARVAAMRREPRRGWLSARLRPRLDARSSSAWKLGFGLVALAVLVVAGGVFMSGYVPSQPGGGSPLGGSVAPSSPPGSGSQPIATPPASGMVSPAVSPAASAPGAGPVGGPVPTGFQPVSVTFVSANAGWLLGSATCTGQPCPAIVRTTDSGRTWQGIPAPAASITPPGGLGAAGVSGLRFADALDGWAFGPDLWATHDGGATWRKVSLPGAGTETQVMALETAAGVVHAAFFAGGGGGVIQISTSPIGTDAWTVSPTQVQFGAGPVPHAQFVLHGTTGWLIEVDRTVVDGARLVSGTWRAWQPPCLDANGPATLAAATDLDLVAACDIGVWSTPTGVHLYASTDAGSSFTEAASKVPVFDIQGVAASTPSATVVGGSLSGGGSALVASFDGGRTWTPVYVLKSTGSFSDLGFTTESQGVTIASSGTGSAQLLMTRDGGHTWSPVTVAGP